MVVCVKIVVSQLERLCEAWSRKEKVTSVLSDENRFSPVTCLQQLANHRVRKSTVIATAMVTTSAIVGTDAVASTSDTASIATANTASTADTTTTTIDTASSAAATSIAIANTASPTTTTATVSAAAAVAAAAIAFVCCFDPLAGTRISGIIFHITLSLGSAAIYFVEILNCIVEDVF